MTFSVRRRASAGERDLGLLTLTNIRPEANFLLQSIGEIFDLILSVLDNVQLPTISSSILASVVILYSY